MATAIGQLTQQLTTANPWWRDSRWTDTDRDLRDAADLQLAYEPAVLRDLRPGGLYVLRGPRRVGKTVAVKRTIARLLDEGVAPHAITHAAVDGWPAKQLRTLVTNLPLPPAPRGEPRWWFLDEISAATGDWDVQVKWLRDNVDGFRDATVVLTGSDAGELSRAAGTLAGRRGQVPNVDRTLMPMGFATFARLWHSSLPDVHLELHQLHSPAGRSAYEQLLPWLDPLVQAFDTYLQYGGFPVAVAAARAGQPVPDWFLRDLTDVVVRDVFGVADVTGTYVNTFLERLWASLATPVNMAGVARDMGVATSTIERHLRYLHNAYMTWTCPQKHAARWIARAGSQSKVYAVDPLLTRLAYLTNPQRADVDPTVLAEQSIGTAVRRARLAAGTTWSDDETLFHVRTATRKEIDFVAEYLGGAAIEGKYTEGGAWRREARTVDASPWDGILATRNVLDTSGDGAWAVPAAMISYTLDT